MGDYDDDDVDGVPMPGDHDGMPLDLEALDKQKEQEEAERQAKLKFQASKWETVDESTLEAQVRKNIHHYRIKKRRKGVRSGRGFVADSTKVPSKFPNKMYIPRETLSLNSDCLERLTNITHLVYLISSFEKKFLSQFKKNILLS